MFGKKERNFNPFFERMTDEVDNVITGKYFHSPCNVEIIPMITTLHVKIITTKIEWNGSSACWHLENLLTIAKYIAENTRNYEKLSDEDYTSLRKLFEELDDIYTQALALNSQEQSAELGEKITCITEIVCKNMVGMHDTEEEHDEHWRDGMIFQSYENLWKVVHRINTEWDELRSRGFSLHSTFYPFWDAFIYSRKNYTEMTEETKFNTFMDILDGKVKFIPVYQHEFRLLGLKTEKWDDAKDEIVYENPEKSTRAYRMRRVGEESTKAK